MVEKNKKIIIPEKIYKICLRKTKKSELAIFKFKLYKMLALKKSKSKTAKKSNQSKRRKVIKKFLINQKYCRWIQLI